ncbi:gastrula zinc finger protein XlCGF49.1-like isoform X2 [Cyprinodon tularosa]|nr:gastrula zinc finger protein XlCGF49.1-like isoform X2 [Cyprinodon tularosa]
MCSVQLQGEFISEQLTPAEETLTEVKGREKRPKVEMDDQHRLLDFTRIPQIILHRIDRLQDYDGKEEVFSEQWSSEQEGRSRLDKAEPEPLQIGEQQKPEHHGTREETMELLISEHEEQLVLEQNTLNTGKKPLPCLTCGEVFLKKDNLMVHIRTHTGEKPFECLSCGKEFTQKSGLETHMIIHTGQKPFECLSCGKEFTQKSNLETHMRIHTGEKPFECLSCGKKFTQKSNLETHVIIHTGEKPFECLSCGKKFTQKHSLETHIRIHTGVKP